MTNAPSLARTASSFRVQVLGPFVLERNGVAIDTARWQRRVVTLLKLLAIAPNQRRSRDEIVDLLWPETTPEAGAGNLRLVVHRLRLALGESETEREPPSRSSSPILLEQGWARLNRVYSWESDLDEFERLARGDDMAALERAAALYRGEPLVEDAYEDWAVPVRERIGREWRNVCLRLAHFHQAGESHEGALLCLERLLEADPLDEEALRGVLRALRELGRGTEALRRFRQFERLLAAEIDVPPDAETLTIVAELESQLRPPLPEVIPMIVEGAREVVPVIPSYPLRTIIPLLGRDAELQEITALLPDTATQSRNLVLVAAEAGVGKTRLLAEVADRARLAGVLTLAGGCYEREGRLPYGPIHDALLDYVRAQPEIVLRMQLDGLLPELVRIVPELRAKVGDVGEAAEGEPESLRLQLFSTVAQALDRIAHDRPLLLALDDLHWADDASTQLLHFLVRQPRLERLLVLGAYRQEEVEQESPLGDLLVELEREEALPIKRLALTPLREADLARLLEQRLDGPCAPGLVQTLYGRSEGNPFFALQMLRLLEEEGRLVGIEKGWDLAAGAGGMPLPPQVRDTVTRRLRHLGAEEREALASGAVLGREFAYPALEAMWEGGESALFRALEAARDAYLLGETETGYAFRHPILREVVYDRLSAEHKRHLHERAGQALEVTYGSGRERSAELAWHFLQGRDRRRALPYATVAADQAEEAFAHVEAERHYRVALELARELGDGAAVRRTLERLGDVLKTVGRYDEALEVLERAAEGYTVVHDLEGERRAVAHIGQVHYRRGTLEEGAARIRRALQSLDDDVPSHGLAVLYLALAILLFRSGRYVEQLEAAETAAEVAQEIGDKGVLAEARLLRAYSLPWTGRQIDFKGALEEVIRLAEEIGDQTTLCRATRTRKRENRTRRPAASSGPARSPNALGTVRGWPL